MLRRLIVSALGLVLAGCTTQGDYTADLSYSRAAGLGYRNAGLYSVGNLYLWNTKTNRLLPLSNEINLFKRPSSVPPTTLSSSSVQGILINGEFGTESDRTAAELSLSSSISFRAENAQRDEYSRTFTAISDEYLKGLNEGRDMEAEWHLREAAAPGSGYFFVVITDIVRADKTVVTVGGKDGPEVGKVEVTIPGGKIGVTLLNGAAAECSGASAPCFFDVTVIKPRYHNGLLAYTTVEANHEALAAALRNN